ncbi:heme oxygenase (biliverdin-producing) [Humidisolicoccus flavus]|uniref:biliverdin-producing heme oxygenase n=1 Tax=Humidisolicoccus flavus TaxID=3111414 RepID=UPI00324682B3
MTTPFSTRLREASAQQHDHAAENSYFSRLMRGELTGENYAILVAQHLAIYRALEAAAALHETGKAAGFHSSVLDRVESLETDLRNLGARDDVVLAETREYVERIAETAADPARFVAHHYTRYLGDLSGGLFIGRALTKEYSAEVTNFYRFTEIPDARAFKDEYRLKLDSAGFTAEEEAIIIEETLLAYAHNGAMLQALTLAVPQLEGAAEPVVSP